MSIRSQEQMKLSNSREALAEYRKIACNESQDMPNARRLWEAIVRKVNTFVGEDVPQLDFDVVCDEIAGEFWDWLRECKDYEYTFFSVLKRKSRLGVAQYHRKRNRKKADPLVGAVSLRMAPTEHRERCEASAEITDEEWKQLMVALLRLSPNEFTLFELLASGNTGNEIAAVLGLRNRSHVYRRKVKLIKKLAEDVKKSQ